MHYIKLPIITNLNFYHEMNDPSKKSAWKSIIDLIDAKKQKSEELPNIKTIKSTSEDKTSIIKNSLVKSKITVKITSNGLICIKPSSKILSSLLIKYPHKDAEYSTDKMAWTVKLYVYEDVKNKIKESYSFQEIPKGVINELIKNKSKDVEIELNDDIYSVLLPFQREGVKWALNKNGRVLLGDEMGLGKTYQALAISYFYRIEWPLLIVAPASLLENWKISVEVLLKMEANIIRSKSWSRSSIDIISYDMAARYSDRLSSLSYKVVITDECHYLKSTSSKRTKNLLPLLQNSNRLVMISGTPALSRPYELFPIISAIKKDLFKSITEFGYRYCNLRKVGHYFDWKGCTNHEELYYFLKTCMMIRRTKDEVLNELPSKFRRQVILEASKKEKNIKVNNTELQQNAINQNDIYEDETIIMRYREAAELKLEPVKNYIEHMLEKGFKFLLFAHHMTMIDGLEEHLKIKTKYVKIDGRTPVQHRQGLVDKFQDDQNVKVALLGLTACSTGITMTSAKAVVFAELYWNPGTMLQAEDRVHRIGQKRNVDIHYLTALGTVDEYVWPTLLKKLNVLEKLGIGNNELKSTEAVSSKQEMIQKYL